MIFDRDQPGLFLPDHVDKLLDFAEAMDAIAIPHHLGYLGAYREDPTKAIVCDLNGGPDAELTVQVHQPSQQTVTAKLRDLVESNVVTITGRFPSESFIIERLVGPSETSAKIRWQDRRSRGGGADYYYVRVRQHNGHVAWAGPIWVG